MKRSLSVIILALTFFSPYTVFAHETKENNETIIFLHVNPNDNPVANQRAGLKFLITGKKESFPSESCDCTASVFDKGTEMLKQKIFTQGQLSDVVPYTFTHSGVFQVKVTGTPTKPGAFRPFSISFNVRISGDTPIANIYSQYIQYISGGIFLLLGFIVLYTLRTKKKL